MNKIKITVLIFCIVIFLFFLNAPIDFPFGTIFKIEPGMSLRTVSLKLKQNKIIRSRTAFEAFVIIYGGDKYIISADYEFENALPVYEVARRISKGERHLAPVTVTIPEGFNKAEIAAVFSPKLSNFNAENFLRLAEDEEGYLFPDTYFFFTTDGEAEVIKSMRANFEKKIETIRQEIISSGKTEKEIIIIASIIEREAKGKEDRDIISGILRKRLAINMPLQVDAAPETYKTKGLPKIPIANPGLLSIMAALYPESSPYLYYLHDQDGNIHYAKNFEEHKVNKLKYLE